MFEKLFFLSDPMLCSSNEWGSVFVVYTNFYEKATYQVLNDEHCDTTLPFD